MWAWSHVSGLHEKGKYIMAFEISGREVNHDSRPLVIAEIGINHGGCFNTAIAMVDAAIEAGAEVIKHQTHVIEDEMSDEAKRVAGDHMSESIYDLMASCALSEIDEKRLMDHVVAKGAIFISTPFSRAAADRLQKFDVPAYKIGSGECNNYPLVRHIASFGKPVILSTGMNNLGQIKPSVEILRNANVPFALLHCTNVYPTPPRLVRLDAINSLRTAFPDALVGLSDHTVNNYTCFGAVALGASIIEKHFTDSMERSGPDISCSVDPAGLRDLIHGVDEVFSARSGGGSKGLVPEEESIANFAFASVVTTADIYAGDTLSHENIWVKRPGNGDFSAADFDGLIGKVAARNINKNVQLKKDDVV